MKLGVFSGSFDPIHEGHVLFALAACDQFGLDKVLFMPEAKPRRKNKAIDIKIRREMVKLALEDYPNLVMHISDESSHTTTNTLKQLKGKYGQDCQISLLMGADVFEFVPDWHDDQSSLEDLLAQVKFIVALRTEDDGEIVIPLADQIDADAQFIPAPISTISSSLIRGGKLKFLNDEVVKYIKNNRLYL